MRCSPWAYAGYRFYKLKGGILAGCTGIVVEVTLGTPKDDHHFTDLCDDCHLKFLKMAVEHLERKVAAEKEGLNNDGEETDV